MRQEGGRVLVVGAGLTGLSTAYHLELQGCTDYFLVESDNRPGGWAKTDWTGLWGADRGVHVLYFQDRRIQDWAEELLDGQWVEHKKDCIIDSQGVRTGFPFHANLFGRESVVIEECLQGLWDAHLRRLANDAAPVTFGDWIDDELGSGVRRHFMEPYNRKMWTVAPEEMTFDWMGRFVPSVDVPRVIAGALRPRDSQIGLNASFFYPTDGISALAEQLAAQLSQPVRYGVRLERLDALEGRAWLSDGSSVAYDWLVSTIPLTGLLQRLVSAPSAVVQAAAPLEAVDLTLVDVGFSGRAPRDAHWVYLPDPEVLAYRLHLPHLLSSSMAPRGHGMYCLEISHSKRRPLPAGSLSERVVDDLVRTDWLRSPEDVVFLRERSYPNAYVLPLVGFRSHADSVQSWLDEHHVLSVGRYGNWTYSNMEDSLRWGREVASRVAGLPANGTKR